MTVLTTRWSGRGTGSSTTTLLLLGVGSGVLLAVPVVLLREALPPAALLLVVPLLVSLGLLGVHRPLWAVAALPASVAVSVRGAGGDIQVVQVLAAAVVACVAVHASRTRRPLLLSGPLLWTFALVLVALASTVTAQRVVPALKVDANLALGIAAATCVVVVCRDERDLRLVLRAGAVGSLSATVPVLFQLGDLQGFYGGAEVAGRPLGVFSQPNDLGSFALTSMWMALALVGLAQDRRDRWLGALAASSAALAVLFSLSRGAWLGAVAGAVALVVLHRAVLRPLLVVLLVVSTCLAGAVALAPGSAPAEVVRDRASTITSGAPNPDDRRDLVWQEAARQLGDAPLLGHGPGSFIDEAAQWDSGISAYRRYHAHNVVLHVGAETGLVGVTVLLGLTAALGSSTVRTTRARRRAGRSGSAAAVASLGAGCVSFAAHGLVDVTFQEPQIMVSTWLLVGVLVAAVGSDRHLRPRPTTTTATDGDVVTAAHP